MPEQRQTEKILDTSSEKTPARLLSIPYLMLRFTTAGGALVSGLVQTFVFARILDPDLFSVFILIGALAVSFWLVDFGLTRIVFIRQREAHLAGRSDNPIARQAAAIAIFHALLTTGSTVMLTAAIAIFWREPQQALNLGLFFIFTSLNLVWFVLRFVCLATDRYIFFEFHEAIRRVAHIGIMLAMLFGLPLLAFLLLVNTVWIVLFASVAIRLAQSHALAWPNDGILPTLLSFLRDNKSEARRIGTYAAGEFYIYNFPYLVVPLIYGLGAPIIILDTTFKIFRGAAILYGAGCDVAVPQQIRALANHDRPHLIRATLMAALLCGLPAILICAFLVFDSADLFALLLGPAAIMPSAIVPILILLLIAGLAQTVAYSLLLHTGFFRQLGLLATGLAAALTLMTLASLPFELDMIDYLAVYASVYAGAALFSLAAMMSGPFRAANAKTGTAGRLHGDHEAPIKPASERGAARLAH
jgi:hypothetical protein